MDLFENSTVYFTKDGRPIQIRHFRDDEESTDYTDITNVYATVDGNCVGSGKYDEKENSFRGIDVDSEYRRQGIATAIYDYLVSLGYFVRPSSSLSPDGELFWANRRGKLVETALSSSSFIQEVVSKVEGVTNQIERGGVRIQDGDWELIFRPENDAVELHMIKVHFSARRSGTGKWLMNLICAAADKHATKLVLVADTSSGDDWLPAWYEGYGFKIVKKAKWGPRLERLPRSAVEEGYALETSYGTIQRFDSTPTYFVSHEDSEGKQYPVWLNPSVNTLKLCIGKHSARGIINENGDIYVWEQINLYHSNVLEQVTSLRDFITVMFYPDEIGVKFGAENPEPFTDPHWLPIMQGSRLLNRAYGPDMTIVNENWG